MTLPYERTWAIQNTRRFLRDLLDPKATPRVPLAIRREAHRLLKHFPDSFALTEPGESIARIDHLGRPDIWQELPRCRPAIPKNLSQHIARLCTCGHPLSKHQDWGIRLEKPTWAEGLECHGRGCGCARFEVAVE